VTLSKLLAAVVLMTLAVAGASYCGGNECRASDMFAWFFGDADKTMNVLTFVLVLIALWQIAEARASGQQQAQDTIEAIEISREAADAAKKSADAAKQSADASLNVELPHFILSKVTFELGRDTYKVGFRNHGRTAGVITRVYMIAEIRSSLAIPVRYPAQFSLEKRMAMYTPVPPTQQFAIPERTPITEDGWMQAQNAGGIVWIYGYFDWIDFMKREHRDGFCVASQIKPGTLGGAWVAEGPAQYTYSRYKSEAENGAISEAADANG
jgi:hypothetical protein